MENRHTVPCRGHFPVVHMPLRSCACSNTETGKGSRKSKGIVALQACPSPAARSGAASKPLAGTDTEDAQSREEKGPVAPVHFQNELSAFFGPVKDLSTVDGWRGTDTDPGSPESWMGMEVSGHCLASAYVPDYLAAGAGQAYPVTSHRSLARERDSHNHMRLCTCEEEYM
jgi:hypothetical protein